MTQPDKGTVDDILKALQERAKELNCLYQVDEALSRLAAGPEDAYRSVASVLPSGYQYPEKCRARILIGEKAYGAQDFVETPWMQSADIMVQGERIGRVEVSYLVQMPRVNEGPFLEEERRLIGAVADRVAHSVMRLGPQKSSRGRKRPAARRVAEARQGWWVIIDFLKVSDRPLLMRLTRRMINHLCWNGVEEAQALLQRFVPERELKASGAPDENRPLARSSPKMLSTLTQETFRTAAAHLSTEEILSKLQEWIRDDKSSFLLDTLESPGSTVGDVSDAIQRFVNLTDDENELPRSTLTALRVLLMRRFFTDELELINTAKNFVEVRDFHEVTQHVVSPVRSYGQLGGKSSGLFLASRIVAKSKEYSDTLSGVKVPKTWYVTSDGLLDFIHYNHLDDVYNRKYLDIDQVRREYPNIVQVFKNSHFSPDVLKGLSLALDDFEDRPLIVRSSSLLEDRMGAAFAGKYKSLFLANQGSKKERLAALTDAIAEVYASVFGPDPIEYRAERGMLDLHEEMGIMIQEVVGVRAGDYWLPTVAGVAFSNNEFRWSPRIRREDGLLRMVPGLGTRAVDRLSEEYPVLIAPGQPGLRVNMSVDEISRYSPKRLDVINLRARVFESVDVRDFFKTSGENMPDVANLVSVLEHGDLRRPLGLGLDVDFKRDEVVVTFEGLIERTPFVPRIRALLNLLREKMGVPVDIEFACDGDSIYLLQCRPQSYTADNAPADIPADLPQDKIIFTAKRYISNGRVPDITHVVYVDPRKYKALPDLESLEAVGRAVSRLNRLLPKRRFILMGPGRWGSRGDVRLGVSVTYSDINNTAALVEIARKEGNYIPDLSFGTHFFQDLVEASIRYLPLYPDEADVVFRESFFTDSRNVLADLLPEYASLADVVRVIDIPGSQDGQVLKLLMDADRDIGVGMLGVPSSQAEPVPGRRTASPEHPSEGHWLRRQRMAERIAAEVDGPRFGVKAVYLFGSVKSAMAGPASDIDLIVHVACTRAQRKDLESWLEGWSRCLAEMNYLRTGHKADQLLDVHFVTDKDIQQQTSYATKIGAVTDAAKPLRMKKLAR